MKKENFSQPDFYHFSDDSIFLVEQAIMHLKQDKRIVKTVIDVCAGSGVVGLQFLEKYEQKKLEITFIEKQGEFKEHIEKNIKQFGKQSSLFYVYFKDLEDLDYKGEDLILCNPPYFVKGSGRLPQDSNKVECRFASPNFYHRLGQFFHYSSQNGASIYFLLPCESEALDLIRESVPGKLSLLSKKSDIGVFNYKDKS